MSNFRDDLPSKCPPVDAREVASEESVFRLVRNNPPTVNDFKSQRQARPSASFSGVDECTVRGLSVYGSIGDAKEKLLLPKFRKGYFLCRLKLNRGAGRIKQTFNYSHHTWWPYKAYNIPAVCEVVQK